MNNDTPDDDPTRDPTQLILPHVDTSTTLFRGMNLQELVLFAPGGVLLLVAVFFAASESVLMGFVLGVLGSLSLSAAGVFHFTSAWYTTPWGRFRGWLSYWSLRRSLPFGHSEAIDATHGIERVAADGSVVCRDGRRVALVRVHGTNVDHLSADEQTRLVSQLTHAVDGEVRDRWWSFYSTTRPSTSEDLADHREERASRRVENGLSELQADVLFDSAEWLREDDDAWQANDWRHYIEVRVHPSETATTDPVERLRAALPFVADTAETADDDTPERGAAEMLTDRVDEVESALADIQDVSTERADAEELVDVGLSYWTSGEHDVGGELLEAFGRDRDRGYTPAERMFAPGYFDVRGSTVRVEDDYARTFWVAEWPQQPRPLFLSELFTTDRLDVDVRINAVPKDSKDTLDELDLRGAKVDGKQTDEADKWSSFAVDDDLDALTLGYSVLDHTTTQPWKLNAYVTVRAESKDALRKGCKQIRQTLESAHCFPVATGTRQRAAFASAAPFAADDYAFESSKLPGGNVDRTHTALSGAFGAMFPFGAPTLDEPGGMRWGRNTLTGEPILASPFQRGTAPHIITLGASRSGKTYGISSTLAEWFLDDDDRTLVVCDTQGGFEGLTELLDGEHVVVDGSQGINPLEIKATPEHVLESTGGGYHAYRLKVDEAREWLCGVLRAQRVDNVGPYTSIIEQALEETYNEVGITSDPATHGKDSPTISDFLDVLKDIQDSPEDYTIGSETELKRQRASDLLDRLSSFRDEGKYNHLVGETSTGIDADTRMAYVDLRQLQGQSDVAQSVEQHLILSQISQLIKQTPGETVFALDEAHTLLHSEEMSEWLQEAAREWARYDACLWFISQSPQEFVRRSKNTERGQENQRQTIVEQCSTLQVFRSPHTSPDTLREFGMNDEQIRAARERLTPGRAGRGYSECLLSFGDRRGWLRSWVETSPLLDSVLTFTSREHGDFERHLGSDPTTSSTGTTATVAADGGDSGKRTPMDDDKRGAESDEKTKPMDGGDETPGGAP